jgi:hypothetical protein
MMAPPVVASLTVALSVVDVLMATGFWTPFDPVVIGPAEHEPAVGVGVMVGVFVGV